MMDKSSNTEQSKARLVVIGNGMAGVRCIEELIKLTPDKYRITIIGEEPQVNYNRIMLSPILAGEKRLQEIVINDKDWYRQQGIQLITGQPVVAIDRRNKQVVTHNRQHIPYDKLIIATGSRPNILPFPGHDLDNVMGFRTIADVNRMLSVSQAHHNAVVIGGGLLGLEAAYGLQQQGMKVTVVHNSASLLNRQIDTQAAELLQTELQRLGVEFKLAARTQRLLGNQQHQVSHVQLEDNSLIPADLVVFATGVKPNKELAESAGIYCENGIVVSDTMQTYDPSIYAIGECIQHRGTLFGLVAPLFQQAKVCANHLAEWGYHHFQSTPMATKLKVTGIDVYSAGNFLGNDASEVITYFDRDCAVYKKLVIEKDRLVGVVLYGDIKDGAFFFDLIQQATPIKNLRQVLMFGRSACEANLPNNPVTEAA